MSFKLVYNFTQEEVKHHQMSIIATTNDVFISANTTSSQHMNNIESASLHNSTAVQFCINK